MRERQAQTGDAKPRIRLTASITKGKNNLTVRCEPNPDDFDVRFLRHLEMSSIPPGRMGFGYRPDNELMFIRGAGNLLYGGWHQAWPEEGAVLCALRAAYEDLIRTLDALFEVEITHAFEFQFDAEGRVLGATLEDTATLEARRVEEAATLEARRAEEAGQKAEASDRAFLAGFQWNFGVSVEAAVEAIDHASEKGPKAEVPTDNEVARRKSAPRKGATRPEPDCRRRRGAPSRPCRSARAPLCGTHVDRCGATVSCAANPAVRHERGGAEKTRTNRP